MDVCNRVDLPDDYNASEPRQFMVSEAVSVGQGRKNRECRNCAVDPVPS